MSRKPFGINAYRKHLIDEAIGEIDLDKVFISRFSGALVIAVLNQDDVVIELEPYECVLETYSFIEKENESCFLASPEEEYELATQKNQGKFKCYCLQRMNRRYKKYLRTQLELSKSIKKRDRQ